MRTGGRVSMCTCLVEARAPRTALSRVSRRVRFFNASEMLLMCGSPMSSCRGWYGSKVTEGFSPGFLYSERSFPPKILVMGVSTSTAPEDWVRDVFCFAVTSSQPLSAEFERSVLAVPFSVASILPFLMTWAQSSCSPASRKPKTPRRLLMSRASCYRSGADV